MNFFDVTIEGKNLKTSDGDDFEFKQDVKMDGVYTFGVRPSDVSTKKVPSSIKLSLDIEFTEIHGSHNIARGMYSGSEFNFVTNDYYKIGDKVDLYLPLENVYMFDKETNITIKKDLKKINDKNIGE